MLPILLFLLGSSTYFAQRNAHFLLVPILLKILLAKFINAYSTAGLETNRPYTVLPKTQILS